VEHPTNIGTHNDYAADIKEKETKMKELEECIGSLVTSKPIYF
jgi:hypothetical protein